MYDFDTAPDRRAADSIKWSRPGPDAGGGERQIIPLWVADMDFAAAPELLDAMRTRTAHPNYGYTAIPQDFYAAFTEWMSLRHGVRVEAGELVFSPGVVPGLALAVRAFTEPGDGILIQPPVYHPFAQIVRSAGRTLVENPLVHRDGRYEIDFEDLERKLRSARMMILCSPHNPVGRVWSGPELERMADLAARSRVMLVSDEIHSDLVFPPGRHTSALALADRSRLAVFHAPSKTFNLAGLQTAIAVIPDAKARRRFEEVEASLGLNNANCFGPRAAETAWRRCAPWLDELLDYLAGNRLYLYERLAAQLPALRVAPIEGSYLAWIDFRTSGIPEVERTGVLQDYLLREAGIWCNEGSMFGTGGSGFVRLNFACPRALLGEALDRLAGAMPPSSRSRN